MSSSNFEVVEIHSYVRHYHTCWYKWEDSELGQC